MSIIKIVINLNTPAQNVKSYSHLPAFFMLQIKDKDECCLECIIHHTETPVLAYVLQNRYS